MIRPGINTVYVNVCLCYAIGEMSGFVWEYTVTLLTQKSGLFFNKTTLSSTLDLHGFRRNLMRKRSRNVYISHCAFGWNGSRNDKEAWENRTTAVHDITRSIILRTLFWNEKSIIYRMFATESRTEYLISLKAWRCKQNVNIGTRLCFLSIVACSKRWSLNSKFRLYLYIHR